LVSAGVAHACGLKIDGAIACWGSNGYSKATPPSGTFTFVSAGYDHTCAVRTEGSVTCWGDNEWQQCTCGSEFLLGLP
jgi:alpha-tubulin suppressor-like RCC1 family protein